MDVSAFSAFSAGFLLFFTPCVLPLVPSYLTYLSGLSLEGHRFRLLASPVWPALFFVAGFSTIFILFGLGASFAGGWLLTYKDTLTIIGGIFIIVMGIHFLHILRIPILDKTFHFKTSRAEDKSDSSKKGAWTYLGATYGVGATFAFSWTPCIGPVLATILVRAGSAGTASSGTLLLAIFALGLAVPFLAAACALEPFMRWLRTAKLNLKRMEQAMGILLILTGLWFIRGATPV